MSLVNDIEAKKYPTQKRTKVYSLLAKLDDKKTIATMAWLIKE